MAVKAFDFTKDKFDETHEVYYEILRQLGIKDPKENIEEYVASKKKKKRKNNNNILKSMLQVFQKKKEMAKCLEKWLEKCLPVTMKDVQKLQKY